GRPSMSLPPTGYLLLLTALTLVPPHTPWAAKPACARAPAPAPAPPSESRNAAPPPPPATAGLREYVRVVERPYLRVALTATVVDRQGKPVRGLTGEDFRVLEDGHEYALAEFGLEGERRDRPVSVAVLLDLAYSMGGQVKKV